MSFTNWEDKQRSVGLKAKGALCAGGGIQMDLEENLNKSKWEFSVSKKKGITEQRNKDNVFQRESLQQFYQLLGVGAKVAAIL